ncbi:type ISP restriction/modification enzyme, partial [Bartonella sp. CL43QHWL]|uniref:type ISP restriction/modification enzyme n=1 Tax=Bartonella sp. CL43QHWL TaxID=3243532 RepID=UPI0035CEED18
RDIGDYLNREEKLTIIEKFRSINGITRSKQGWQIITPDKHGDWIKQRDDSFETFLAFGYKKSHDKKLFETFSRGIMTSRDAWTDNSSCEILAKNMRNMIAFYNSEVKRFNDAYPHTDHKIRANAVNSFVNSDTKKISWSYNLKKDLVKGKSFNFKENYLIKSLYRPFTQQWLYCDSALNCDGAYQTHIFPIGQAVENKMILLTGIGAKKNFSVLMIKTVSDLQV